MKKLLLALLLTACGDNIIPAPDAALDAAPDAVLDAGAPPADAQPDAPLEDPCVDRHTGRGLGHTRNCQVHLRNLGL